MAQTKKTATDEPGEHHGAAETISAVMVLPFDVAKQVLPERGLPVYLGIAALTVTNVIEWPVAIAAGLGYLAFRGWQRPAPGTSSQP